MRCNIHDFDKLEEGIAIGEERAKLEAARNMLLENDSTEKVARCLGLPLETVQNLAEELKTKS